MKKAFDRLAQIDASQLPSDKIKARLLGEINIALHELQAAAMELYEQNEELSVSRLALEEQRSRYQELFDFAPDGYLVTDSEGIIIAANNAAAKLFQVSNAFLIGNSLACFIPVKDRFTFRTHLAEIRTSSELNAKNWELDMLSEKRSAFPVSVSVGKVAPAPGNALELRWLLRDITTERKLMEYQLMQSENRFAKIFDNSPMGITIVSDIDDRYIDFNRQWEKLTGYSREEVIGKTAQELNILAKTSERDFAQKETESNILHETEYELCKKSGEKRYVALTTSHIQLNNEPCRLVVARDITEEKRIHSEMARLDRLNLIGEMAAGIGHEIRNPMTSVRGFIQMLSFKEEYKSDRLYFDLMIEELDRANSIISEYLRLAKNKRVELEILPLDKIILSLAPMIQSDTNIREINLTLDLNNPPNILIDENEVRQLILNLARNGMEAMTQQGSLTIGTGLEGDEVVLYIRDEGPGIDPASLSKLGNPFFTTKDNGTGLGLAICYSIAARHKARIDYETAPSGTTFFVRFPLLFEPS